MGACMIAVFIFTPSSERILVTNCLPHICCGHKQQVIAQLRPELISHPDVTSHIRRQKPQTGESRRLHYVLSLINCWRKTQSLSGALACSKRWCGTPRLLGDTSHHLVRESSRRKRQEILLQYIKNNLEIYMISQHHDPVTGPVWPRGWVDV